MNESALYTYQQEQFNELRARLSAYGYTHPPMLDIDYGWVQLINDMLDELDGVNPDAVISQVVAAEGSLLVVGEFSPSGRIIVDQYIDEAMITCEATGRQDALWYNDTGRLRTLSPLYVESLDPELRARIVAWDE